MTRKRHLKVANLARDAKRWGEARANYEVALAEDPELTPIWVQLGHACKELGDLPGAEAAYCRALALRPDIYDTHLQIGHLLKVMGRTSDSVHAYAEAVRLQPGPSNAADELTGLGLTTDSRWAFTTNFSVPMTSRLGNGSMWFTVYATPTGIAAPDLLGLHAKFGLQLGCTLHTAISTAPATHAGTARLDLLDEITLRCRFVLACDAEIGLLQLAQLGFFYGELGVSEAWREADAWMVIDLRGGALGRQYRKLTGTS